MRNPFRKKKHRYDSHIIATDNPQANKAYQYPDNQLNTTKYNLITFVPRFLYEQFRRLPNLYFLIVAIITCVPNVSPISPVSAVLPFVLIILTAAVKEAYEDFKRWQSDKEINNRLYEVFRNGTPEIVRNKDIRVGDIVHLTENQEVPADIALVTSSGKEGICYVDTANLDGETNLKLFKSLPETANLTSGDMLRFGAVIKAQPPNEKLYDFTANMIFSLDNKLVDTQNEEDLLPLGKQQLLMRGVRIRNTKDVYGVVVYTGKQTKLALNAVSPPSKFSQTERIINWVSLGIFGVKIALVIVSTIISNSQERENPLWYAPLDNISFDSGVVFMAYFVLLGYFIPISLFVNLELLKLIQAGWMMADNDLHVKDSSESKGMRVKNSNLNDELSRVSYIFSDKTGTLTQNKMIFDQCSIAGRKYPDAGAGGLKKFVDKNEDVKEFLLNMVLNNEVLPEAKDDLSMPKYAAPSPDEIALVKGAYENGIQFRSRGNAGIEVYFQTGEKTGIQTYEILNTFEFSSERKRSSAIIRADDKIVMYTKGADSVMKPRLTKKNNVQELEAHLIEYSREGLRTLVFARKQLSPEEYKRFNKVYLAAANTLQDRETELEKVMNEMEQDLEPQGCSAIQDALQDKVPFTIDYLVKAGIRVWMITGDQQDTAENIGFSCKLITKQSEIVRVVKCDSIEKARDALLKAKNVLDREKLSLQEAKRAGKKVPEYPHVSLVIDGQSLVWALSDDLSQQLLNVGRDCETVIVCRADPLQKALVVRLMKRGTGKICLSIGDGANDVSMLQEAHIGVGIWGEEGSQAANNSDYSIRLFKHLAKLVTVHGRYNMLRTGIMVEFSFYKNLALFASQFWFGIFNRFSAQTFFDDWVMAAYNVAILSLPPLSLAIFEKDIKEEVIMKFPETYRELRRGLYFTRFSFSRWMVSAALHSLVIYFSIFFIPGTLSPDGKNEDLLIISTIVASAGVFAIVGKAMVETKHWVWPSHVAYWLSYIALFGLLLIESSLTELFPRFAKVMHTTIALGYFWFMILIVFAICIIPEICYHFIQRNHFPYLWQIVQERIQMNKDNDDYSDQYYSEDVPEFPRQTTDPLEGKINFPKNSENRRITDRSTGENIPLEPRGSTLFDESSTTTEESGSHSSEGNEIKELKKKGKGKEKAKSKDWQKEKIEEDSH